MIMILKSKVSPQYILLYSWNSMYRKEEECKLRIQATCIKDTECHQASPGFSWPQLHNLHLMLDRCDNGWVTPPSQEAFCSEKGSSWIDYMERHIYTYTYMDICISPHRKLDFAPILKSKEVLCHNDMCVWSEEKSWAVDKRERKGLQACNTRYIEWQREEQV